MVIYLQLTLISALLLCLGVFVVGALFRFSLRAHWFVVITVFFTFADVRLVGHRHTLETYFCALLLLVHLALYTRKTV